MTGSKKTHSKSAKKQTKGKSVKIVKKSLPKTKAITLKKTKTLTKKKVKTGLAKTAAKQKDKAVLAKKAKTRVKSATKVNAVKKVNRPAKQKTRVVVAKKIRYLKKGGEKNAKPNAKTRSTELKAKILAQPPVVPQIDIHGEDLHFIPEHNEITLPITPLEAHKKETTFHNKEEVAFHQENQKVRNAMPSRKTMKAFYRSRGRK